MLQHNHFDLVPGEALWIDKGLDVEDRYPVTVVLQAELDDNSVPCMWMHDREQWIPFAFTDEKFSVRELPPLPGGPYNLGVRWLNCGGIEHTDENRRTQWARPGECEDGLVTMMSSDGAQVECPHVVKKTLQKTQKVTCHVEDGRGHVKITTTHTVKRRYKVHENTLQ